jgi:branched-chain amino acid transport system substrate-binding protein
MLQTNRTLMKQKLGMTRRAGLGLFAAAPLMLGRNFTDDITVGALLSLTGSWSTLGLTSQALLQTAVGEINTFFGSIGSPGRIRLQVEDTRLDPATCVNSLRVLAGSGARLVIGPQSSAEAAAIRLKLEDSKMIAISQGSTASSLSLPGDNLFRFVPDDSVEAQAVVAMALAGGIQTIVPCWRADAGNQGLAASVRRLFTAAGGKVTAGVEYSTDSPVFADVVKELAAEVSTGPSGKTAVYLAAFDEVVDLFRGAVALPALQAVPWYGSDGVALSAALASDSIAAAFAVKTGYANPTLLRPDAARAKWEPLVAPTVAATGLEPDAFGLAAYDAFWCGMMARLLSGSNQVAEWKQYLSLNASMFFGTTGWAQLNANGDRAQGDYEFWALRSVNGSPKWTSVATWQSGVFALR